MEKNSEIFCRLVAQFKQTWRELPVKFVKICDILIEESVLLFMSVCNQSINFMFIWQLSAFDSR